jgi:hypothetical protein
MHKHEIGEVPIKLADSRLFVRINEDGKPQLIRIEPLFNDDGILIPVSVLVHVDNDPAVMMDRNTAEMLATSYTPLENVTWQNKVN